LSLFKLTVYSLVVLLNLGVAALEIALVCRRRPAPRGLIAFIIIWAVLMVAMGTASFFPQPGWKPTLRQWLYFPMAVEMVWNLLFVETLFLGGIILTLVLGRARPVAKARPLDPAAMSRRRFIYLAGCGAAPAVAIGMGVHGTITRDDLRVRRFDLPVRGLPAALDGFTLAHTSDYHSGIFCGPKRLARIAEQTNALKADLVAMTGDIINSSMDEFRDAARSLLALRAPQGIFLCEGNHDVIPGPGLVRDACRAAGLPFLFNSTATVPVGDARLVLAGLPWMQENSYRGRPELVAQLFPPREAGDYRILLGHHPHMWDIAPDVDLTLSGHTHGGQLMAGPVGFGPLFFRYWSGLYQRPGSEHRLIVSNGGGDWFPCRIGAPAEVALIKLTRAA
jgi:predicted MPP superfamily phosphohydrolase